MYAILGNYMKWIRILNLLQGKSKSYHAAHSRKLIIETFTFRHIDSLKEEIVGGQRKITMVEEKIENLQLALDKSIYKKEIAFLKLKIQVCV